MGLGMNLHRVVREAVQALHPDMQAVLYRSTGQTTAPDGTVKAAYAPGRSVWVQQQSESPATLFHADQESRTEESRKFYVFSEPEPQTKVTGIYRPLSRNGDIFQLADGSWWLVTAMVEDFSRSGWVSVRATVQTRPPEVGTVSGLGAIPPKPLF